MAYTRNRECLSACGLAVVACAVLSTTAAAQPNPFEDHEQGEMAPEALPADDDAPPLPDEPGGTSAPTPSPEQPSPAGRYKFQQWHWSVGAGTQFAYTGTTNEVLTGPDETNRTFFLTLAPRGSLFVADHVEVALSLGLLSKLAARESGGSVAENNFFFAVSGHYHILIPDSSFAFIPGLGIGGYFGGSSREFTLDNGNTLDETTATRGFLINGHLGIGYHVTDNWRLESGITVGGLFGSEKLKSLNKTLGASAATIGLPLQVVYVF